MTFLFFSAGLFLIYAIYTLVVYYFTRVPFITTPKERYDYIFSALDVKSKVVCDLGCGTGSFLLAAAKYKPSRLIGYELSPLICWLAKIKLYLKDIGAELHCQNFLKANISQVDIIYIFLVPAVVQMVSKKIWQEAKSGTIIIVLADMIIDKKPFKVVNVQNSKVKIFFYKV